MGLFNKEHSVGKTIATLRKEKGWTQVELAEKLQVSDKAVSKWEKDQTSPDTLNLIRLAEVLNTDMEYLATGQKKEDSAEAEPVIQTVVKEVERIVTVETVVDRPIIRRRVRVKYRNHPGQMLLLGTACFLVGLILGLVI